MTTYYHHNLDGSISTSVDDHAEPMYNPYGWAPSLAPPAYRPDMMYQMFGEQYRPQFHTQDGGFDYGQDGGSATEDSDEWHETEDGYYSDSAEGPLYITGDYVGYATPSYPALRPPFKGGQYPDPELIRDRHTLLSMLPHIEPSRLQHSYRGPRVDIVEEDTGHTFAIDVPKKMLVLFCGRKVVSRFLRTLEREDNENWEGGPVKQELRFPRYWMTHIGLKILVSWMDRACHNKPRDMRQIRVPKNLFAALCLSRTLAALSLHRDANRVDNFIAAHHYRRPLYPDEIFSIWNCLPKDSKYTYRMVKDLRRQLRKYEDSNEKAFSDAEQVLKFLDEHPELKARVDSQEYNDEFRPFFGTDWCARAALRTQQTLGGMAGMAINEDMEGMEDTEVDVVLGAFEHKSHAPVKQRGSQRHGQHQFGERRHEQKIDPPQSKKPAVALNDWKPQAAPTAWPKFDKTIVLKILDGAEKAQDSERKDSAHGSDGKAPQW